MGLYAMETPGPPFKTVRSLNKYLICDFGFMILEAKSEIINPKS